MLPQFELSEAEASSAVLPQPEYEVTMPADVPTTDATSAAEQMPQSDAIDGMQEEHVEEPILAWEVQAQAKSISSSRGRQQSLPPLADLDVVPSTAVTEVQGFGAVGDERNATAVPPTVARKPSTKRLSHGLYGKAKSAESTVHTADSFRSG